MIKLIALTKNFKSPGTAFKNNLKLFDPYFTTLKISIIFAITK